MQILPAIDLRNGKCVRLRQGDYQQETIFNEDPVAVAREFEREGAERLHLVDLDGAKAGRPVNTEVVRAIVRAVGIPCQLGGGFRDEASVRMALEDVGIDRVIVGTQALKQPEWFAEMTEQWPRRIALGLDARNGLVATAGWTSVSETSIDVLIQRFLELPVAAVIYTNIANDGMMQGIDDGTIGDLTRLSDLGLPMIASGGVTTLDDLRRLKLAQSQHPRLIGAIIGRALYEGTIRLPEAIAGIR